MAKFSNEIVQFCAGNENTSKFLTRFQDYYAHTLAVNGTKNMAYDTALSLDEKASKVSEAFFAEVESRSGVQRNALNKDSWMAHPNVQWAAMSIIDATINSVLPMTINPSVGIFTDLRFVSYGDVVHFNVKPRTLYVVSEGNLRPAC